MKSNRRLRVCLLCALCRLKRFIRFGTCPKSTSPLWVRRFWRRGRSGFRPVSPTAACASPRGDAYGPRLCLRRVGFSVASHCAACLSGAFFTALCSVFPAKGFFCPFPEPSEAASAASLTGSGRSHIRARRHAVPCALRAGSGRQESSVSGLRRLFSPVFPDFRQKPHSPASHRPSALRCGDRRGAPPALSAGRRRAGAPLSRPVSAPRAALP